MVRFLRRCLYGSFAFATMRLKDKEVRNMAKTKVPCLICGKTDYDPGWPAAKYCSGCGIQLCSKCGSGREKCPKCGKYALK
jgi:hypothetical protein